VPVHSTELIEGPLGRLSLNCSNDKSNSSRARATDVCLNFDVLGRAAQADSSGTAVLGCSASTISDCSTSSGYERRGILAELDGSHPRRGVESEALPQRRSLGDANDIQSRSIERNDRGKPPSSLHHNYTKKSQSVCPTNYRKLERRGNITPADHSSVDYSSGELDQSDLSAVNIVPDCTRPVGAYDHKHSVTSTPKSFRDITCNVPK